MSLDYFPFYYRYEKQLRHLSDQEVGRLVRALLEYGMTEEEPELAGREETAFYFMAADIDRAKESYENKCRSNRENASKRWNTNEYDGIRTDANHANTKQNKDKNKTKEKEKINKKEKDAGISAEGTFEGQLQKTVEEWLRYKQEKGHKYAPTGAQKLFTQIRNNVDRYGEDAVIDVINRSMAANYQGIVFDWLRKETGGMKTAPVLQEQRQHTGPTSADIDRMQRLLHAMNDTEKKGGSAQS